MLFALRRLHATYLTKYGNQSCAFSVQLPKNGHGVSDDSASMYAGEGEYAGTLEILADWSDFTDAMGEERLSVVGMRS